MENTKRPRGRPRKPVADKFIQKSIRMPVTAWEKIDLHGLDWLREVIRTAKPQQDAKKVDDC